MGIRNMTRILNVIMTKTRKSDTPFVIKEYEENASCMFDKMIF